MIHCRERRISTHVYSSFVCIPIGDYTDLVTLGVITQEGHRLRYGVIISIILFLFPTVRSALHKEIINMTTMTNNRTR